MTFVFLGVLRRQLSATYHYLDLRDSFNAFDKDHDGKLDEKEVAMTVGKIFRKVEADDLVRDNNIGSRLYETNHDA